MNKIILLGYMGCGKSTIAKLVAKKLNLQCLDLDEIIEESELSSVKTIFSTHGEIYFRKLEHEILSKLVNNQESFVLSLGGGTPCYSDNHLLLKGKNIYSIYLNASIETLCERLKNQSENRPLLANKNPEEIKEFIAKNLFDRSYYYNQALYKINVDHKTVDKISSEIELILT